MNRRFLILSALAVWAQCSAVRAQIIVPAESKLGEPIVASVQGDVPEGAKVVYDWRSGAGVSFLPVDSGQSLHVWAKPGTHRLEVTVATQVIRKIVVFVPDPAFPEDVTKAKLQTLEIAESLDVKRHEAPFTVEGAPEPPPGPKPPDPLPEPKPGTLGALVPADARVPLAEFYSDWASTVRSGVIASTSHFRTAHQQAATALQSSGKLPSLVAVNKPISDKLAAAIGLEDASLDVAKRELLAAALDSIASEFRGS